MAPVVTDSEQVVDDLAATTTSPAELDEAPAQQFAAATQAAIVLVRSGALGLGRVRVEANGHANPNHEPQEGYSDDFVIVRVVQAPAPQRPTEAPAEAAQPVPTPA